MNRTLDGNPMDETSMAFLRECCPPEGYWVAFSGGKDSVVILDLVRRSGCKHEAHYNITNVDPPELVRFIKREYPDVKRDHPDKNMWRLIAENGLPCRTVRFCCKHLKERGGVGRYVVTGIRHAESLARRHRGPIERDNRSNLRAGESRVLIHPIFNWLDLDVWQYIHERGIPSCELYQQGWRRIGCVLCPFAPDLRGNSRRYPKLFAAGLRALRRYYALPHRHANKKYATADERWEVWLDNVSSKEGARRRTCDGLFV